jgi:hypothetical protein
LWLLAASVAGAAEVGHSVANDSDKSVSTLVSRWAALDGRTVKREAAGDFPIHDAIQLSSEAHLANADGLDDAFERLSKKLVQEKPDAPVLFACAYKAGTVAMVIREVGQPECGKALH